MKRVCHQGPVVIFEVIFCLFVLLFHFRDLAILVEVNECIPGT